MNAIKQRARSKIGRTLMQLTLLMMVAGGCRATDAAPTGPTVTSASAQRSIGIDELVAPVALYPDDLVAIILPASTFPLQVIQAGDFLTQEANRPGLQPGPEWDASIVALLNYPEVVERMNADLAWTRRLGEAVLTREPDVMDALQRFRRLAVDAGQLHSDEYQVVTDTEGVIEIAPRDPGIIYIPDYDPRRVVHRTAVRVIHYYPAPYPSYYYRYPASHLFGFRSIWGTPSVFTIGWQERRPHVYRRRHAGHVVYGHHRGPGPVHRAPAARPGSGRGVNQYRLAPPRPEPRTVTSPRGPGPRAGTPGRGQARGPAPRGVGARPPGFARTAAPARGVRQRTRVSTAAAREPEPQALLRGTGIRASATTVPREDRRRARPQTSRPASARPTGRTRTEAPGARRSPEAATTRYAAASPERAARRASDATARPRAAARPAAVAAVPTSAASVRGADTSRAGRTSAARPAQPRAGRPRSTASNATPARVPDRRGATKPDTTWDRAP